MSEQLQDRIRFDTRLIKRNLERGRLEPTELDSQLQKLPDVSDKAQPLFSDGDDPGGKG